jgi:hypothetical protein
MYIPLTPTLSHQGRGSQGFDDNKFIPSLVVGEKAKVLMIKGLFPLPWWERPRVRGK